MKMMAAAMMIMAKTAMISFFTVNSPEFYKDFFVTVQDYSTVVQ